MKVITSLRKAAAYRRTVAEIKAMPQDVAWDLNIVKEDARKIAARAVYDN